MAKGQHQDDDQVENDDDKRPGITEDWERETNINKWFGWLVDPGRLVSAMDMS